MTNEQKQIRVFGKSKKECEGRLEKIVKGGESYTPVRMCFFKTPVFFGLFNRGGYCIDAKQKTKEETK